MTAPTPAVSTPATLLRKVAVTYAGRTAVTCGDRELSYAALAERCNRLANALSGSGIAMGDRVAMLGDNCLESLEQIVGTGIGGFVRCSLHAHDAPARHRYLIGMTGSRVLVVQDHYYDALVDELDELNELELVVVLGDLPATRGRIPVVGYEEWLAAASAEPPGTLLPGDHPNVIRFTSGTTGFPKGIVISVAGTMAMGNELALVLPRFDTDDRYLAAGPLTHAASMFIYSLLAVGATTIVLPRFDPAGFLRIVEQERVTATLLVPTMIQMVAEHPDAATRDVSSLRAVMYGAAPISTTTLSSALRLWGNIMYQLYGQSEVVPMSVLAPRHHHVEGTEVQRRRLGSAGLPTPNSYFRIVDDRGAELPTGEIGEIEASAPCVLAGIWQNDEAAAERITPDGWIRTRDMGYVDEDGFLFLADRKEDLINSGGFNIWPAEIEQALTDHPAVDDAAVVGVAHPKWGETPQAAVVLRAGHTATEDELVEWTRERVGSYKKVTGVLVVDELPRTPLGKLLRSQVRERHFGSAGIGRA
ncbi:MULTISPECIES: class I adenylate-forming enzyme family protein [Pseudonocardia]|uniref:Long-chain-fatty-acid--CoA ligase n=2 Tax=Pseudonocardia TaxID=1847 RepID=A0A1Y2NAW9_PSEAH|nr:MULTISPECIES: AMP-binding protein [Pseudonocardia]OSY44227.1 Long-chain-fatty-acid--CoA ligase [Pseudonocardia autotrophica]TDN74043.1 acyl-CoA synthetase (AMP-forming)/AMP-acid ligase II [Pseudonocardia autotrophica]BBG04800.1 AMP-dependent acyl-CoA synthetase [Pseudonocardia autotrophica]GEC23456.1 AMP-dependent acyl-CoA synthetase [Pseudonocardia saturnea]